MKLEPGNYCPLIKKDCIQLKCNWFLQIKGMNPNTGQEIDDWGCAISWLPVLLIEGAKQQRDTAYAVQSFRNEMAEQAEQSTKVMQANLEIANKIAYESMIAQHNEPKLIKE